MASRNPNSTWNPAEARAELGACAALLSRCRHRLHELSPVLREPSPIDRVLAPVGAAPVRPPLPGKGDDSPARIVAAARLPGRQAQSNRFPVELGGLVTRLDGAAQRAGPISR